MLFSTIISVINFPAEMAIVGCGEARGSTQLRDQYLAAMSVRAHRRDLDAADGRWLKAKFPDWLDRQKQRMHTTCSARNRAAACEDHPVRSQPRAQAMCPARRNERRCEPTGVAPPRTLFGQGHRRPQPRGFRRQRQAVGSSIEARAVRCAVLRTSSLSPAT